MPFRRALVAAGAALLVTAGLTLAPAGRAAPSGDTGDGSGAAAGTAVAEGLPDGVPAAAQRAEPALPEPAGWPFPEAFPRTSGTGRLAAGALSWSDFLYDDHGALGVPVDYPIAGLAPPTGTYTYPAGAAAMNGADIFRTAVGLTATDTWWRVDWNTLADPTIPIAEFAIDTDNSTATGAAAWAASAGVTSAGTDKAIVVSSRGAWLHDLATGVRTSLGPPIVDTAARSFVVAVPRGVLPVTGTSRIRLAAGRANAAGDGFAPVTQANGAAPGQPAVYNVAFRAIAQEPAAYNLWMEQAQAAALSRGDVSAFSTTVAWADLAAGKTTPEPRPTGYSNRWYVSSIELGQGAVHDPQNSPQGNARPNFLGRVQPYAVYVPTTYDGSAPVKLTWILHSLGVQHNQYGATNPKFIQQACEVRRSICATTLGRGPDGWYYDEAELDFWEVWNRLAGAYRLDPERTAISGYSMGGWGTYKLALAHPDLFARAVVLEGPVICGLRVSGAFGGAAGAGRCTTDGDSVPLLDSARNLPFLISHGALDQLVPVTGVVANVQRLDTLGFRYRFELYPAADHAAYPLLDAFSEQAFQLDAAGPRTQNPQRVTYAWYPNLDRADLGLGATGAYWVRDTVGRTKTAGSRALADATSRAIDLPAPVVQRANSVLVPGDPFPAVVQELTWTAGARPPVSNQIDLSLANVGSLGLDLPRAGIAAGTPATVAVVTDGPSIVTLLGIAPGAVVAIDGVPVTGAAVTVPTGTHAITVS